MLKHLGIQDYTQLHQNPSEIPDFKIAVSSPPEPQSPLSTILQKKRIIALLVSLFNDPLTSYQEYLQTIHYPEAMETCSPETLKKINLSIIDSAFDVHHEDF